MPILATPDNVKDFFNGKDLTGWDGNASLWKVAGGEIIGTSPGLKRNEYLRSHMLASGFRLSFKVKSAGAAGPISIVLRGTVGADGAVEGSPIDLGKWTRPGEWNE